MELVCQDCGIKTDHHGTEFAKPLRPLVAAAKCAAGHRFVGSGDRPLWYLKEVARMSDQTRRERNEAPVDHLAR